MYKRLRDKQWYEDIYDKTTVDIGRRGEKSYDAFRTELVQKMLEHDPPEDPKRPGNIGLINMGYMSLVGNRLLDRYDNREVAIKEWMERDKEKDQKIADARLSHEPPCQHCGRLGLKIFSKELLEREGSEEVIFILKCSKCDRNSSYWEDGSEWEGAHTYCPKCNTEMEHKTIKRGEVLTTTYTCPKCEHSFKDKLDLRHKQEPEDPDYDKDRYRYCFHDKKYLENLREIKAGILRFAELGKIIKEKNEHKEVDEAVAKIRKPRVADLISLLTPVLEKNGYIELRFEKPEVERNLTVEFSCLDSKNDRNDYSSRSELKRLIEKTLKETNWRLMTDGVSFRLGYLSGRLKAYENQEELRGLVEKQFKKNKV